MRSSLFFLAVVLAIFSAAPAHAELVAYWDFEGTLNDAENGFDGTYQNATTTATGEVYDSDTPSAIAGHSSSSLILNPGSTNYNVRVSTGGTGGLLEGMQNQGTVVAWFKGTTFSGTQYVFGNINNGTGNRVYITPQTSGTTTYFRGSLDNPNLSFAQDATRTLSTDTWYHAALVWRKDGTANLYLNGSPDNDGDTYTPFDGGTMNMTTRIGAQGGAQGYFRGLVDDIAVFKDALTQPQIQALFEGTRTPFNVTPEPGCWTLLCMGIGTLGLLVWRRRRR